VPIALEGIAADEFGEAVGLVRVGGLNGAHFVEGDRDAAFGQLPGGLRSGESATNDRNVFCQISF
jgi:hypothetical protein